MLLYWKPSSKASAKVYSMPSIIASLIRVNSIRLSLFTTSYCSLYQEETFSGTLIKFLIFCWAHQVQSLAIWTLKRHVGVECKDPERLHTAPDLLFYGRRTLDYLYLVQASKWIEFCV